MRKNNAIFYISAYLKHRKQPECFTANLLYTYKSKIIASYVFPIYMVLDSLYVEIRDGFRLIPQCTSCCPQITASGCKVIIYCRQSMAFDTPISHAES